MIAQLKSEDSFYATFKHDNIEYRLKDPDDPNKNQTQKKASYMIDKEEQKTWQSTGEIINLLTVDSWFVKIPERLKFKCFKELATVKYSPPLNLKSSE